ncbi:unnamed protein product [marine sediment metagenome]|uniref:C2H2-type domain-containing protein n=1 Tax=marine sediment metagenome TaxID=412755 RepID=X1E3S7_9ZZZZ
MSQKAKMQCWECGKKFTKTIGPRTHEVRCPKCGSYDTVPLSEFAERTDI